MRRYSAIAFLIITLITPSAGFAQQPNPQQTSQAQPVDPNDPIARIREEGLKRSHVLETLSYLTDVIGPRLTASPNMKRAND